jgi:putative intracellular protease/amidase
MRSTKILFIATSKMTDTNEETGVWLEELAAPYYIFKEAGAHIKIASPAGGRVPLDPKSQSIILATLSTKRFLKDEEATNFVHRSKPGFIKGVAQKIIELVKQDKFFDKLLQPMSD